MIEINGSNVLTAKEVADATDISLRTVQQMLRDDELEGRKVAGKWFVTESSVEKRFVPDAADSLEDDLSAYLSSIECACRQHDYSPKTLTYRKNGIQITLEPELGD